MVAVGTLGRFSFDTKRLLQEIVLRTYIFPLTAAHRVGSTLGKHRGSSSAVERHGAMPPVWLGSSQSPDIEFWGDFVGFWFQMGVF
jgi:hypothetical protein